PTSSYTPIRFAVLGQHASLGRRRRWCFAVRSQLLDSPGSRDTAMKLSPDELDPRTITLVDDEPSALDVLVRAARSWRYRCQSATSAEQALELLERRPTRVVVTDLRMPGRGGVWLVREIQRRWPDVSVIVIPAGQDEDAVSECLRAGAHHHFLKPVKLDGL